MLGVMTGDDQADEDQAGDACQPTGLKCRAGVIGATVDSNEC